MSSRQPKSEKKRLRMRDIAAHAGVAPITVSRALSDPTKVNPSTLKRIMEVVEREGFIPDNVAGSMRTPSKVIGTIVPPLINSGIADQVQGMSDGCAAHGYQLLLVQGDFSAAAEEKAVRALLGWRPKGLIIQAFVQSKAARESIAAAGVPMVEISEIKGRTPMNLAVGISNFDAAYAMTQHLAGKGYCRIGFVSTPVHGNDRLRQRRVGYRKAIADLGLDQGDLEVEVPITSQGGAAALSILVERDPGLDVIFCSSDTLAIGAIQECLRRGWAIPGRIGVAGFGDMDLASQIFPAITTVRVDRYAMGRAAVEHLLDPPTDNGKPVRVVNVGFQIVDRDSA